MNASNCRKDRLPEMKGSIKECTVARAFGICGAGGGSFRTDEAVVSRFGAIGGVGMYDPKRLLVGAPLPRA